MSQNEGEERRLKASRAPSAPRNSPEVSTQGQESRRANENRAEKWLKDECKR